MPPTPSKPQPRAASRRLANAIGFAARWGSAALLLLLVLVGLTAMRAVWPSAWAVPAEKPPSSAFFTNLPEVLNIAHRGASGAAPEHTLEAYELALARGAHVLELDVHMTLDEVLVVAHDADLLRTSGLALRIAELPWHDLRTLAGSNAPLTLDAVFERFPNVPLNLEIKPKSDAAARALARSIEQHSAFERVLVASFHATTLESFRSASGGRVATSAALRETVSFLLCYLLDRPCRPPFVALQLPFDFPLWLGRPEFVRFAHAQGLVVHYWTVDDPDEMARLLAAGADGVMTNHPERLTALLSPPAPQAQ